MAEFERSYRMAKTAKTAAEARMANLKAQEAEGKMVDRTKIDRAVIRILTAVRTRLLALPGELAPKLSLETSAAACHAAIDTALRAALADLEKVPVQADKIAEAARTGIGKRGPKARV